MPDWTDAPDSLDSLVWIRLRKPFKLFALIFARFLLSKANGIWPPKRKAKAVRSWKLPDFGLLDSHLESPESNETSRFPDWRKVTKARLSTFGRPFGAPSSKQQASSSKLRAPSSELQALSYNLRAPSLKYQFGHHSIDRQQVWISSLTNLGRFIWYHINAQTADWCQNRHFQPLSSIFPPVAVAPVSSAREILWAPPGFDSLGGRPTHLGAARSAEPLGGSRARSERSQSRGVKPQSRAGRDGTLAGLGGKKCPAKRRLECCVLSHFGSPFLPAPGEVERLCESFYLSVWDKLMWQNNGKLQVELNGKPLFATRKSNGNTGDDDDSEQLWRISERLFPKRLNPMWNQVIISDSL